MSARSRSSCKEGTTACKASPSISHASWPSRATEVQLLYEEEGELKVGTVLAQAPASFQVESPHGRRSKVKAASVLLSFDEPPAAELLARAQRFADGLETEFLWQCSGPGEFDFRGLAREYVGREPTAVEAAG